ncbi:MAG: hypothetical protein Q4C13_02835, partial [Clostridia bacterium]|nr:hypothetical protein [Clostridia bacterium]
AWQLAALLRYRGSLDSTGQENLSTAGQLKHILGRPVQFFTMLAQDVLAWLVERLIGHRTYDVEITQSIGVFGAALPLVLAPMAQDKPLALDGGRRASWLVYCILAVLITQALTVLALYLSITPVGSAKVPGVSPRYAQPVQILALVALSMLHIKNEIRHWPRLISGLTLVAALNYSAGMLVHILP